MYPLSLFISAVSFVLAAIYFVRKPSFNIFHPVSVYMAFQLLIFVVRPIVGYYLGYDAMYRGFQFTPSESNRVTVILASNAGFLMFVAGALYTGNVPMRFNQTAADMAERRNLRAAFLWVWVLLGPLALYSVLASVGQVDTGLALDRSTGVAYNTTTSGYATDAQIMFISLTCVLAWIYRFRLLALLPLISYCLYRATTGYRVMMILAIFMALLLYAFDRKIARPNWRILMVIGLSISAFVYIGADRGQGVREALGIAEEQVSRSESDAKFMESMDFANMEFFEYLVWVIPEKSGTYDYFLDNFQIFTEPVPRTFWTGKPMGEPFRRIWLMEYGTPFGMTRSLPGEGWYAFGWPGVIFWCGIWGLSLGWVYRKFAQGPKTTLRVVTYLSFEITLIPFYRDGQLLTFVRLVGPVLLPCGAWLLFAKWSGVEWSRQIARRAGRLGLPGRKGPDLAAVTAPGRNPDGPDSAAKRGAARRLPPAVLRRQIALARDRDDPE